MTVKPLWIVPRSTNNLPLAVGGGGSTDTITATTVNVSGTLTAGTANVGFLTGLNRILDSRNLTQGIHFGWNDTGSDGVSQIINKRGSGLGGFAFYQSSGDGSSFSTGKKTVFRIEDSNVIVPETLTVNGVFRRTPAVMVRRMTSGTLITPNVDTAITFGTNDTLNSTNPANTGLTVSGSAFTNTSGVAQTYFISYSVGYASDSTGTQRIAWIGYNGLNNDRRFAQALMFPIQAFNTGTILRGSTVLCLQPNDFFTIFTWHDGASNLGVGGAVAGNTHATRVNITAM